MATRSRNKLTARQVEAFKEPGRYADGGNLYLSIDKGGRRRWVFMPTIKGKRVELGVGSATNVTLAKARETAEAHRALIARGGDPRTDREKKASPTFGEFADAYVTDMRPSWRNEKHAEQWTMTLTKYAAPIRSLAVDEVCTEDVLTVLKPLWLTKSETAKRLRGRIENVLDAARAKGFSSGENPARWRGHLDRLLPKRPNLTRGHHAALPYSDMTAFMADLRSREADAARLLELVILTAVRSGEALRAVWAEIDLSEAIWVIPAVRMKAGREHRVPLAPRVVDLLRALDNSRNRETAKPTDYVFAGTKPGRPVSGMAMAMLLRRMKSTVTVHGFRSAFRDWASETTDTPHEVCEMALAHSIPNKAEAAYRRGDLLDKRRKLMEAWSRYCAGDGAKIVKLVA